MYDLSLPHLQYTVAGILRCLNGILIACSDWAVSLIGGLLLIFRRGNRVPRC